MFGNVGYSYSQHDIAEKKERCGIISSIKMDFDGLRLEPWFSSLASFITLRKKRTLRDYLIHKCISMDFVSNQGSHPLLPSLHCGKKERCGIISSINGYRWTSSRTKVLIPCFLHYIAERAGLSHP
jgi:hypothetical protein